MLELLQPEKRDTEILKMVEVNQENRLAALNALDHIKSLIAGTLCCSGQIVLNEDYLIHAKDYQNNKKREMMVVS